MAKHARPSHARKVAEAAALAVAVPVGILAVTASPAHAATHVQAADQIVPVPLPAVIRTVADKASPPLYTVQGGNSLSQIAGSRCGNPADWTGIYVRNKAVIGGDPNLILPGQQLVLDCTQVQGVVLPQPPAPVAVADQQQPQQQSYNGGSYGNVNPGGYSGVEACIIARESGGNSQVMNSTGHYGLFQFDQGTWAEGGGNPADFGHAPVAEQQSVFNSVFAQRGVEPWQPSDGC